MEVSKPMFRAKTLIPAYSCVRNRYIIPDTIGFKDAYNYINDKLQEKYKDDFIGFYGIWDTASAADEYNNQSLLLATGKMEFYLHIYAFLGRRAKPLYMQAKYTYSLKDQIDETKKEVHYWLTSTEIGGVAHKSVRIQNAGTFINKSFLTGVLPTMVYATKNTKGIPLSAKLPSLQANVTQDYVTAIISAIRMANLTDGVSQNPFYIITNTETHSLEALEQALLVSKFITGTLTLNQWTTRLQRSQNKRFRDVYDKMYPTEFYAFYNDHKEDVSILSIYAGAYVHLDCFATVNHINEEATELLLFNPFASVSLNIKAEGIDVNIVHRLCKQSYDESLNSLGDCKLKDLLLPLKTA